MDNQPTTCDVCNVKIAIYHCPRCSTSTCSLECCRAHKTSSTKDGGTTIVCSGKRDRTKFCSLKGFNDAQLASDYHFLEDVLKVSEGSKRLYDGLVAGDSSAQVVPDAKKSKVISAKTRFNRDELSSISQDVPLHPLLQARNGKGIVEVLANGVDNVDRLGEEHKALIVCSPDQTTTPSRQNARPMLPKVDPLVRQAELKGINLLCMPPGMQRHLSNTSKYNKKNDSITWKLELNFHLPSRTIHEDNTTNEDQDETTHKKTKPTMFTVESQMIDSSSLGQELEKHLDVHPGNSSTRSALRTFVSEPRKSLLLFLKCLPCSSAAPKYYELDSDKTLAEVLRGKTIIEFPTVDVVAEEDKSRFPLLISEVS
ncbi:hypothetical protein HJC23_006664 [Cyclotella cryptica]|uniref:HIT-type domain-containing protein n=1 Tax=Cyclotella cryptica TaxID=29204 RepID=A0ABD3QXU1_9STRA|eukprot:CCRYP_001102-RA/>CCRYP_001102-RA protein AED:0.13 eAED:0.13 QI:0/-1/0/1/-1/1/1/0/368